MCCDLLSNFGFTFFDNNNAPFGFKLLNVVICFQTLDLRSLITTTKRAASAAISCDLLSNFGFTFFDNNYRAIPENTTGVVICFQTLDLRSLITTLKACCLLLMEL